MQKRMFYVDLDKRLRKTRTTEDKRFADALSMIDLLRISRNLHPPSIC